MNHSEILKLCILSTVGWFNKKIISPFFYVADAVSVAPTSDGNQGQVEKSSILNSSGATGEEERDTKIEKETDDSELAAGLLYIVRKTTSLLLHDTSLSSVAALVYSVVTNKKQLTTRR